ncbi:MAG: hypothetical protein WCB19_03210 [Thermoplasmata archaeon]
MARTPATFYSTDRIVGLVGFTVVVLFLGAIVATSTLTLGIEFIVVFLVVGIPWCCSSNTESRDGYGRMVGSFPCRPGEMA